MYRNAEDTIPPEPELTLRSVAPPPVPLHFGASSGPLYGVFHPAAAPGLRSAVLVLAPWGWEALRAHRTLHLLAERLARHGHDTLRFDYSCSGDSTGDPGDVSADRWLADAEEALDEVLAMSGARSVTLVGLRLGGLLAMSLAARRPREVDRLVLWESARSGTEFLRWMEHAPPSETGAFPVTERFAEEVGSFSGDDLDRFGGRILSIASGPLGLSTADAQSFQEVAPPAGGPICWIEDRNHGAGAVPADTLGRIAEWLDD